MTVRSQVLRNPAGNKYMDPIADMLTSIRNAGAANLALTTVPYSKLKFEIANVLLKEGYIKSFRVMGKKVRKHIEIEIAYRGGAGMGHDKTPRVEGAERISKLSRRVYIGAKDIRPVKQGIGSIIISTPKGLKTGKEARKEGVGGEALFSIW